MRMKFAANYMDFIVLPAKDTLAKILDEVEVFAPGREDVFLADLTANLVALVVNHHAEIRIDGSSEFFEQGNSAGLVCCFCSALVIDHGVDEVASCAVGDVSARRRSGLLSAIP